MSEARSGTFKAENTSEGNRHLSMPGRAAEDAMLHYPECGLDNVYLVNGFHVETIEGEPCVVIDEVEQLWKAIGTHIVEQKKTLSPKEVRFLRHHLDMSQAELGFYLRLSDQTIARWEKGESFISGPADVALRTFFLLSPVAQPEGRDKADGLMAMLKNLSTKEEFENVTLAFRHLESRWREDKAA